MHIAKLGVICLALYGLAIMQNTAQAQRIMPNTMAIQVALMLDALTVIFASRNQPEGRYDGLRPEVIVALEAAPPSMIIEGELTAPWPDGLIEAAPFSGDPNFARIHMEQVPATLCKDLAVILINQENVIGLYIGGQQIPTEERTLGEFIELITPQCGAAPVTIDVIIG
ncbi:MAG: hypothetical protein AAF556_00625 [Pseudomonadota bacterium]